MSSAHEDEIEIEAHGFISSTFSTDSGKIKYIEEGTTS
jgi:hypothetical protein